MIPIRVSNVLRSFATEAEVSALVEGMPGSKYGDRLWFRFPLEFRDQLGAGGEPFVAALLPTAMALGIPLSVEAPVDEEFLSGCQQIMSLYASWDRRLHRIEIRAPLRPLSKPGFLRDRLFLYRGGRLLLQPNQESRSGARREPRSPSDFYPRLRKLSAGKRTVVRRLAQKFGTGSRCHGTATRSDLHEFKVLPTRAGGGVGLVRRVSY